MLKKSSLIFALAVAVCALAFSVNARAQETALGAETPLHIAAADADLERAEELIDGGADLDAPDASGATPLMLAIQSAAAEIAEKLIWAGADALAADADGLTAAHFAARENLPDLMPLLLDIGADFSAAANDGTTPLHLAVLGENQAAKDDTELADEKRRETADFILSIVEDPNAAGPGGKTAAHLAAEAGRADIVEMLANLGADFVPPDDNGQTPLDLAAQNGRDNIVEFLQDHLGE